MHDLVKKYHMDSLPVFMRETYIVKPDNRITAKDIYDDFRAWVIGKHGTAAWNNITQRQVYAALKGLPDYAYIRFREGYCLKGIGYKSDTKEVKPPISEHIQNVDLAPYPNTNLFPYLTLNITRNMHISEVMVPEVKMPEVKIPTITLNVTASPLDRVAPRMPTVVMPRAFQLRDRTEFDQQRNL